MFIRNVTRKDLEMALASANVLYSGNLSFVYEPQPTNAAKTAFRVRLRVKDSAGPGARRSATGRRTTAACWHAHGVFFDALPLSAEINTVTGWHRPKDAWEDWNVGSVSSPIMISTLCDCNQKQDNDAAESRA